MEQYIQDKLDMFDEKVNNTYEFFNATDGGGELQYTVNEIDVDGVRNFIQQSLTDYHNHIVERAEEDLKLLKKVHKIELDTIALKSIDELVKWSEHRKQFLQDTNPKE